MDRFTRRILAYSFVFALVMGAGIAGFSLLEGFSPFDSLYLTVVTVATVGYGDLHPVTAAGKALAIAVIVGGVGCFVGLVANAVEHLVQRHDAARRKRKNHHLSGLFFSRVGMTLLTTLSRCDPRREDLAGILADPKSFDPSNLRGVLSGIGAREFALDARACDLSALRDFLAGNLDFLSLLSQNPDLDEHAQFPELLLSLIHLWQELSLRGDLHGLPDADYAHLSGDLARVYRLLVLEWAVHVGFLKGAYPYLYSLALRANPFDAAASVVVRE
ncbi:MAG: potassium channel family protein [Methanolinea sp.]